MKSYQQAQQFARKYNINSPEEWYQYVKRLKPKGVPLHPDLIYNQWNGWVYFLGIFFFED
jgi:hypothetical protein